MEILDLGRTAASGAAPREGFERLSGAVALGEVGLVRSRELSRRARPDEDWCPRLEVCQICGTLIGDAEQIYDLALVDAQLVLGSKAPLSVVALKGLTLRLRQGREERARRGELKRLLPVGSVRDLAGPVGTDPDQRVQAAIALVFRTCRDLASGRQTFRCFRTPGVELPVNKSRGGWPGSYRRTRSSRACCATPPTPAPPCGDGGKCGWRWRTGHSGSARDASGEPRTAGSPAGTIPRGVSYGGSGSRSTSSSCAAITGKAPATSP